MPAGSANDPRAAREAALDDIRAGETEGKLRVLATAMQELAKQDARALKARRGVKGADAAYAKEQAEAQAEQQPDITQFFPSSPVNAASPSPGVVPSFGDILSMGGSANQIANRAVAPARQQAGTLPSAQPSQQPGGGGGMSVNVGGQSFTAPETLTTTRETTAPLQFDPGFFAPVTTREVMTEPNALRAGDILSVQARMEEQRQTLAARQAEFELSHSLDMNQAKAAIAADYQRTTNAPPAVAVRAADAAINGRAEEASQLLSGFTSTGSADIDATRAQMGAQRALTRVYEAKATALEQANGLNPGVLYSPLPSFGYLPGGKAMTPAERYKAQATLTDDVSSLRLAPNAGAKASLLNSIGETTLLANERVMVLPKTGSGWWQREGTSVETLPPQVVFGLFAIANGAAGDSPDALAVSAKAAKALTALNLGTRDKASGQFIPEGVSEEALPWARRVHSAYRAHTPEMLQQLMSDTRFDAEVRQLIVNLGLADKPKTAK